MFLITQSSRKKSVYLSCERYGKGRITRKNIDVESRKFTGTKKCQCPFTLTGKMERQSVWRLYIQNGKHNHPAAIYHHGHGFVSRLSKEQLVTAATLTKSHVKPKEILDHLRQQDPSTQTTLRHIYNARNKFRTEELGGRSVMQHLMQSLQDNNYMHWHRTDPSTNEVIDLMFTHPRSIDLLRLFPYVVLMDSTYKTNRYQMPLVEIIGVTPMGKNFTVASSFIKHESEEHYGWVLRNLRQLFDDGVKPAAIVTDRELGLMKALDRIFPDSPHLLCLFHINKNVQLMASKLMGRNKSLGSYFSQQKWQPLVESQTEQDFNVQYRQLLCEYEGNPQLLGYLKDTWLVHKEKFVYAWTNNIFHLGNRTTNRVESAHNSLKLWLGSSTGAFDTVWSQIHSQLESQINEIEAELAKSSRIRKHVVNYPVFYTLGRQVTHLALAKLEEERQLGLSTGVWITALHCSHYLRSTHGLPCAHEIGDKEAAGDVFYSHEIHPFWRTLDLNTPEPVVNNPEHKVELRRQLYRCVDELCETQPERNIQHVQSILFNQLYPQTSHLEEPTVQQTRGRPKKNPTKRDPSAWEYSFSKFSIGSSSGSERGRGMGRSAGRSSSGSVGRGSPCRGRARGHRSGSAGRGSPLRGRGQAKGKGMVVSSGSGSGTVPAPIFVTKYAHMLPMWLLGDIMSSVDVMGDGNCGFRCVAETVYGSQHYWMTVRLDLWNEMKRRKDLYKALFGTEIAALRVSKAIAYWADEAATFDHWMNLADMGLIIATCYNAMVLELSAAQNQTFFPLTVDGGVDRLQHQICIAFDHTASHFILLRMSDDSSLPPINKQWQRYRDQSVGYLRNAYANRFQQWEYYAS